MKKSFLFNCSRFITVLFIGILLFPSCGQQNGEQAVGLGEQAAAAEFITAVDVITVQPSTFHLELVSNGKLRARQKSRIAFPLSEALVQIHVHNGQRVQSGQALAQLCVEKLNRSLEQARIRFARASISMEDILLGRGFMLKDSLRVPAEMWRIASINSGYAEALAEVRNLETDIANATIRAPFAGVVAGLEARMFEQVNAGDNFCVLIDNSAFQAEFSIMENELPRITIGALVEVIPFGMDARAFAGTVSYINPMVDEYGRIMITATVAGAGQLVDGMNVRIRVKKQVPAQLVVPRAAVVYRDQLEVLFKYVNGKAEWTYVHILHQNSNYFSVVANPDRVASLQPGDTVIVSQNMNLAHGSQVKIR